MNLRSTSALCLLGALAIAGDANDGMTYSCSSASTVEQPNSAIHNRNNIKNTIIRLRAGVKGGGIMSKITRFPGNVARMMSRTSRALRTSGRKQGSTEPRYSVDSLVYVTIQPDTMIEVCRVISHNATGLIHVKELVSGIEHFVEEKDVKVPKDETELERVGLLLTGKKDKLKKMIRGKKFDIDHIDGEGRSLLYHASRSGLIDMVELLVQLGADPDIKTPENATLLYIAAQNNHPTVVSYLLNLAKERKTPPSILFTMNSQGAGPLHISCQRGHYDIAKMLLENGAPVDQKGKPLFVTPLYLASVTRKPDVIRLLLKNKADTEEICGDGQFTALHGAATEGNHEIVEILLDHNANMSAVNKKGLNCFLGACASGNVKTAELFVKAGMNPNARSPSGNNGIIMSTLMQHDEMLAFLLDHGCDPNETLINGASPLLLAVEKKNAKVARMLLEGGANPNTPSSRGLHPITIAAFKGDAAVVEALLEHGANPNPPMNSHLHGIEGSPLQIAQRYNHMEVVNILSQAGAK